jgi:hypothetical protein
MKRRELLTWHLAHLPAALAVRAQLNDAVQSTATVLRRESLFRTIVFHDDAGEPIAGANVYDPDVVHPVIAAGRRGDLIADAALRDAAAEFKKRYRALPNDLQRYMTRTKRQGRRAAAERNLAIVAAVARILDEFPEHTATPSTTRPGGQWTPSACWVVAAVLRDLAADVPNELRGDAVLRITEKAVLRVWEKRKRAD